MLLAEFAALDRISDVAHPPNATSSVGYSLVLGVLTHTGPGQRENRNAHRQTWLKRTSPCVAEDADHGAPTNMVVRFVLEERERESSLAESVLHSDLSYVVVPDGRLASKPLAWLRHAAQVWPAASLIGKCDMDTFIYPCMLMHDLELHRMDPGASLYYGTMVLWHGCAKRGPPRMVCYSQGGLYVLSRHLTLWVTRSGHAQRHAALDYAFEDVTLGSWIRHFAEAHREKVHFRGEGTFGDRNTRLARLAAGQYSAGPFVHLNLNAGGNATTEPVDTDWCVGIYSEYGCCAVRGEGRRLRRHCATLESKECRTDPLHPRPVAGCQPDARAALHPKGRISQMQGGT